MAPNPMKITGFGDLHGPKPYELMEFGDLHGPTPYKLIGFGDSHGPKPYKLIGFGDIHGNLRPQDPRHITNNTSNNTPGPKEPPKITPTNKFRPTRIPHRDFGILILQYES